MTMDARGMSNPKFKPQLECGLSLVEVLIALLVLSIGLVGMASLQLTSLKAAHSSYYRSLASAAALDTEERLWLALRDTVLQDPATTSGFCMSDLDIDKVIGDSQTAWTATTDESKSAGIPGLTIEHEIANPTTTQETREDTSNIGEWTYQWREIPIRLTWIESRFGQNSGADFIEQFNYVIQIPCVSKWTGGTSP